MADTDTTLTSDLPTPRFRIGQTVYRHGTASKAEMLPCPDCLGSRKWAVTTPGGTTLSAPCQRCSERYSSSKLPSLDYVVRTPMVRRLTVGSVRVETDREPDQRIAYMAVETGIGSGSLYYERDLSATEGEALERATAEAAVANLTAAGTPERIEAQELSRLTIDSAAIKNASEAIWSAWYAYRRLREDVEGYIGDMPKGDDREALQDMIDWERDHREAPPLGGLLACVATACETGSVQGLTNWREEFAGLAIFAPDASAEASA